MVHLVQRGTIVTPFQDCETASRDAPVIEPQWGYVRDFIQNRIVTHHTVRPPDYSPFIRFLRWK